MRCLLLEWAVICHDGMVKKLRFQLQMLGMFFLLISVSVSQVFAASFTSALIRPSTHTVGQTPLPILISVKTTTAAAEDSIKITIPSEYSRSSTASDYTVTSALLPDGYQAWPGIGTATNVSGTQVTFPSGNLQTGITYGFYLTGGITSNPAAVSQAESVWQIESFAAGSQVDITSVTVPVESSSNVNVTATVPPLSSYFSVDMTSNTSAVLAQAQTATYTVTYSTQYPSDMAVTVQASWSQGTIAGGSTPSVDVAEYVAGSGSTGFGGATPTIDPVARTITWTIPALSSSDGEQSVTFALKTTANYKGSESVTYTVSSAITDPVVSLPSEVTQTYTYSPPAAATSTSTPTPTPTPTPSASPGASPSAVAAEVISLQLPTITDSSVDINVLLSLPASVRILYGLDPSQLRQTLVSPAFISTHLLSLRQLEKNTRYYFRVQTTTEGGTRATSELYTFITASGPPIGLDEIVSSLHYQGIPLLEITGIQSSSLFILPENQVYQLVVRFPSETALKNFRVSVLYDQLQDVGAAYQIPFVNTGNNTYVATIQAQAPYGRYNVMYDIEDYLGNKQSSQIGTIKVVRQMKIIDGQSSQPVEHAAVTVQRFNTTLQMYEDFDLLALTGVSEWRSDQQGIVKITLPYGRYKLTVSAPSYKTATVDFEVNEQTERYPEVILERENIYIFGRLKYFWHTLQRAGLSLSSVSATLHSSQTLFTLVSIISMLLLSAGLILSFSAKTHIPVYKLPQYLITLLKSFNANKEHGFMIQGKVINADTQSPVSKADIALMDDNKTIIATAQTASNGFFHVSLSRAATSILVTEPGFLPNTYYLPAESVKGTLLFKLHNKSELARAESWVSAVIKFITSSLFEFMLVVFCVAQFYFVQNFGWLSTLPFMVISVLNLGLWTSYLSTQLQSQQFTEIEAVKQN